jgi:hypothetical protein
MAAADARGWMTALEELLDSLFDGKRPALYADMEGWSASSRRFRAFVTTYRDKLRAKLKNARDEGGMLDVRAELETAALLLRAEQFSVAYEMYAASKQRGPDFTVTFKTHTPFNVEVRRIRRGGLDERGSDAHLKLMAVLCEKVGQMPPGIMNVLWLIAEPQITESDIGRAALTLRRMADHHEGDYFTRHGLESAAAFRKQYPRLSAIVLRQPGAMVVWLNPLARHPVPPAIVTILRRLVPTSDL